MTAALLLRDIWMYSLQVALLVGAVAIVGALFNARVSRAGLLFWQAVLIACLALPFCQTWKPAASEAVTIEAASGPTEIPLNSKTPVNGPARADVRWEGVALSVLGAGILLRLGWLVLGLWSLRRLRRTSSPLPQELEPFLSAQRHVGAEARFHSSGSAPSPVTFGLRRPVVLLPESVLGLDAATQNAIAYHELLHVKGRDWIQLVAEECVHALLWFHPAIWWLLDRIHLTREQVVDRAVIDLTESRQGYVTALLAVAALPPQPALFPATLFLRKSRLRLRVNELFKETPMSRTRLLLSLGASAAVVVSSAIVGARLFPLEARAAAPHAEDSVSIQVKGGSAQLLHTGRTEYPRTALRKRVEGAVDLELSVDEQGLVSDVRVLDGPRELRAAALASALKWHFAPAHGVTGGASGGVAGGVTGGVAGGVQGGVVGGVAGGVAGGVSPSMAIATITFTLPDDADRLEANLAARERIEVEEQAVRRRIEESSRAGRDEDAVKQKIMLRDKLLEMNKQAMKEKVLDERMRMKFVDERKMVEMARNEAERNALASQRAERELQERQIVEVRKALEAARQGVEERRQADNSGARREQVEQQLKERIERLKAAEAGSEETDAAKRQIEELSALMQKLREVERQRLLVPGPLVQIRSERVPEATLLELQTRLAVSIGDTLDTGAMRRIVETVRHFDEHLRARLERNEDGGLILVIVAP
jgi:bla regulator protein BlaR1